MCRTAGPHAICNVHCPDHYISVSIMFAKSAGTGEHVTKHKPTCSQLSAHAHSQGDMVQDSAVAERHSWACKKVASGVALCAAPPASRPAGLLHDVPAYRLQVASVDLVAHANPQAQQVTAASQSCCQAFSKLLVCSSVVCRVVSAAGLHCAHRVAFPGGFGHCARLMPNILTCFCAITRMHSSLSNRSFLPTLAYIVKYINSIAYSRHCLFHTGVRPLAAFVALSSVHTDSVTCIRLCSHQLKA